MYILYIYTCIYIYICIDGMYQNGPDVGVPCVTIIPLFSDSCLACSVWQKTCADQRSHAAGTWI